MSRFLSVILLLLVLSLTGCGPSSTPQWKINLRKAEVAAYQMGKTAHGLGVPSTANPYAGNRKATGMSRNWLQGWMDAEKERRENSPQSDG